MEKKTWLEINHPESGLVGPKPDEVIDVPWPTRLPWEVYAGFAVFFAVALLLG